MRLLVLMSQGLHPLFHRMPGSIAPVSQNKCAKSTRRVASAILSCACELAMEVLDIRYFKGSRGPASRGCDDEQSDSGPRTDVRVYDQPSAAWLSRCSRLGALWGCMPRLGALMCAAIPIPEKEQWPLLEVEVHLTGTSCRAAPGPGTQGADSFQAVRKPST